MWREEKDKECDKKREEKDWMKGVWLFQEKKERNVLGECIEDEKSK